MNFSLDEEREREFLFNCPHKSVFHTSFASHFFRFSSNDPSSVKVLISDSNRLCAFAKRVLVLCWSWVPSLSTLIFDHLRAYLLLSALVYMALPQLQIQWVAILGLQPSIELKASSIFWFLSCEINQSKWQNLFFPCEILCGIKLNFQCTSSLMILMMMLFFVVVCFFWDAICLHEQGTSLFSLIELGAAIGCLSSTPVFFFSFVLSFSLSYCLSSCCRMT